MSPSLPFDGNMLLGFALDFAEAKPRTLTWHAQLNCQRSNWLAVSEPPKGGVLITGKSSIPLPAALQEPFPQDNFQSYRLPHGLSSSIAQFKILPLKNRRAILFVAT